MKIPTRPTPLALVSMGIAGLLGGSVVMAAAGEKEKVCRPGPGAIRVVAETSYSGLALARGAAGKVAPQAAQAAAETCATLSAAVSTNRPEADVALDGTRLTPPKPTATDRTPSVKRLRRRADAKLREDLLEPLRRMHQTEGSPVYGMILATARHVDATGERPGCNIYLSDGIAIERLLGGEIDMRRMRPTGEQDAALRDLVPHLKPLKGGIVAILGAGGDSRLGDERLLHAQATFERVMEQAGITAVWSRSTNLPASCGPHR